MITDFVLYLWMVLTRFVWPILAPALVGGVIVLIAIYSILQQAGVSYTQVIAL